MKNNNVMLMLCTTLLFAGLMVGIFLGRLGPCSFVQLSNYDRIAANEPEQTKPYYDETVGKININLATAEEISMLPGIGMTYAERIVAYREKNGPFVYIDDLKNVKGIGESRIQSIKKYITLGE